MSLIHGSETYHGDPQSSNTVHNQTRARNAMMREIVTPWIICIPIRRLNRPSLSGMMPIPIPMVMRSRFIPIPGPPVLKNDDRKS